MLRPRGDNHAVVIHLLHRSHILRALLSFLNSGRVLCDGLIVVPIFLMGELRHSSQQLSSCSLVSTVCLPPPGSAPVTCAHIKHFIAEAKLWKAAGGTSSVWWLCHAHRAPVVEGSVTPYPGLSGQRFPLLGGFIHRTRFDQFLTFIYKNCFRVKF